jgi:predicted nucleic acid-binding protein
MIFLDTNIISYYFNANNKVKEKLMEAVDSDEEICTTVMKNPAASNGVLRSRGKSPTDFSQFILGVCCPAISGVASNGEELNRPKERGTRPPRE